MDDLGDVVAYMAELAGYDSGMEREFGAREAYAFVRSKDFAPSGRAIDAASTDRTRMKHG